MSSKEHYVIIGNGPAGNQAAFTLRENDTDAKITIISDEWIPFYYKPKIISYISDRISKDALLVDTLEDYKEKNIRIRLGQEVERIDPAYHAVYLKHMEKIIYTDLIIASGSGERILPTMQTYAEHLTSITSYTDALEVKQSILDAEDFLIFGGDFVGFKFMRMLIKMGKKVTILIYPNAFWPYNLNDDMLAQITDSIGKLNVKYLVHDDISQVEKQGDQYHIQTMKGVNATFDMLLSFNGLVPNIDFVKGTGIDFDYGVLVDEFLQTNIERIYSCGSCAQIYHPQIKTYVASIGWPNAENQGKTAALNLLGAKKKIEYVGRKYFDLEGVKIKTTWWEDFGND